MKTPFTTEQHAVAAAELAQIYVTLSALYRDRLMRHYEQTDPVRREAGKLNCALHRLMEALQIAHKLETGLRYGVVNYHEIREDLSLAERNERTPGDTNVH